MGRFLAYFMGFIATVFHVSLAWGHFQTLIPTPDIVTEKTGRTISLDIIFTHPMQWGPVMEMGVPRQFGVLAQGKKQDLRNVLKPVTLDGRNAYTASYKILMPADYVFYVEPAPYWEPAEQKMIIHYTKVIVDAFGAEEDWDTMVGFPVEIDLLTPTSRIGAATGNVFSWIPRTRPRKCTRCSRRETTSIRYARSVQRRPTRKKVDGR